MENSQNCFNSILQSCKYDNRNIIEETVLTICNNTSFDPIHNYDDPQIRQNNKVSRPLDAQNYTPQQVGTYFTNQNARFRRVSMAQQNSSINPERYGIIGSAMQGVQIKGLNNMVSKENKDQRIMAGELNRQSSLNHMNVSMPVRNNNFRQYPVNNQSPQIIPIITYQYHYLQPTKQVFAQNIDMNSNSFKEQQTNVHGGIPNNKNSLQFVGMARRLSMVPKNENPTQWNYSNQVQVNSRSYSITQKPQWKDDPNSTNSTKVTADNYRTERYVSQNTNGQINQLMNHSNKNSTQTLGVINQVEPINYNGSVRNRYYHGPGLGLGK